MWKITQKLLKNERNRIKNQVITQNFLLRRTNHTIITINLT